MILLLAMLPNCHSVTQTAVPSVWKSDAVAIPIPPHVERIAVMHPRAATRQQDEAYTRLEAALFGVRTTRPSLRIVDRADLTLLLEMQQRELGAAAEDQLVHAGRFIGLDSFLLFRIHTGRDTNQAWATITAKLLALESAEILFHHVVAARMSIPPSAALTSGVVGHAIQAALDAALTEFITDLEPAFGLAQDALQTSGMPR